MYLSCDVSFFFFFFQAEDGIRDLTVTGVQTCALPILYLQALHARSQLDQGRWTEAAEAAALVLGDSRTSSIPRIHAGVVLGLVRARRGDPGSDEVVDQARALSELAEELQYVEAVAAARAEAAWLRGDRRGAAQATQAAFELATALRAGGVLGELALWRRRAGLTDEKLADVPEP